MRRKILAERDGAGTNAQLVSSFHSFIHFFYGGVSFFLGSYVI